MSKQCIDDKYTQPTRSARRVYDYAQPTIVFARPTDHGEHELSLSLAGPVALARSLTLAIAYSVFGWLRLGLCTIYTHLRPMPACVHC